MVSSTALDQEYQQAQKAYIQGNYEEAAKLAEGLVQAFPNDPNSRLLQGHIYSILQQYELAREQYQVVLNLTEEPEIIDCANKGLESLSPSGSSDQLAIAAGHEQTDFDDTLHVPADYPEWSNYPAIDEQLDLENLGMLEDLDPSKLDFSSFDRNNEELSAEWAQPHNSFSSNKDSTVSNSAGETSLDAFVDPFDLNQAPDNNRYQQPSNEFLGHDIAQSDNSDSRFEQAELPPIRWFDPGLSETEEFPEMSGQLNSFGYITAEQLLQIDEGATDADMLSSSLNQHGFHEQDSDENHTEAEHSDILSSGFLNEIDEVDNAVPASAQVDIPHEPSLDVKQGRLAFFENASWQRKQLYTAGAVGVISAVVVAACSSMAMMLTPQQSRASVRNTGGAMAVAVLIASGATTLLIGRKQASQIQRTTADLNAQFDAVRSGELDAKATVYSKDEFGLLASRFNEMTHVIFTTTSQAQRKAKDQEQAKENGSL